MTVDMRPMQQRVTYTSMQQRVTYKFNAAEGEIHFNAAEDDVHFNAAEGDIQVQCSSSSSGSCSSHSKTSAGTTFLIFLTKQLVLPMLTTSWHFAPIFVDIEPGLLELFVVVVVILAAPAVVVIEPVTYTLIPGESSV